MRAHASAKSRRLMRSSKKRCFRRSTRTISRKTLFQCDTYKVRKMGLSLQEEAGQGIKHRRNSAFALGVSSTSGNVLLQCALLQLILLWIILHRRCKRKHIAVVLIAIHGRFGQWHVHGLTQNLALWVCSDHSYSGPPQYYVLL